MSYFCYRNNGVRKNPIKAGSLRWIERNGIQTKNSRNVGKLLKPNSEK